METSENIGITISGRTIAKNTIYNLLGYGVPMLFALFLIPRLINGLGIEKFGILNLAWMVIGYFSFFDFGIGRSLTKIVAEKIGLSQESEIPSLFWTSLFLMFAASLFAGLVLIFFIPSLINIFNISTNMRTDALITFYALAASIPIVSTTAGLRGVLEAYQKFALINVIRVILGIFTFLGPLLVLIFTTSLYWIVVFLIFIRIIIWLLYLLNCFKVNKNLISVRLDFQSIKPVLKFSIWISIANIVGPIIAYSDRFLIGVLLSAAAITFYATPYEIITKLLLIPSSLAGVLFPLFSATYFKSVEKSKKILERGIKFIFLILYPIIFIIISFSYEGMELWLGAKFAYNSYLVLQFLSIGILMNSISLIPNNFFQGIGKPKIPTLINLIELPFYIGVMWFAINKGGITGAALTYMIMATLDAILMYIVANKMFKLKFKSKYYAISFLFMIIILFIPLFMNNFILKFIFSVLYLITYILIVWIFFLSEDEKYFINLKLKLR